MAPRRSPAGALTAKTFGHQLLTSARDPALSHAFTGALLPSAGFAMDSAIYAGNELAWNAFRPAQ